MTFLLLMDLLFKMTYVGMWEKKVISRRREMLWRKNMKKI